MTSAHLLAAAAAGAADHTRTPPVVSAACTCAVTASLLLLAAAGTDISRNTQAVLDRYQALLREYRLHKQALGDWFSGVLALQRRPPQLLDAQATGDEALVAR